MADFLTERTKFFCTASPAVNFSISTFGQVTHKGDKVLTTATKLSGSGTCTLAQGAPCQFIMRAGWKNFDAKCKAGGKNLLTENSFCLCKGMMIRVKTANARGFKQGSAAAASASSASSVTPEKNFPADKNSSSTTSGAKKISAKKNSSASGMFAAAENFLEETLEEIKNAAEKFIASIKTPLRCKKCKRRDCKYRLDDFKNFSAQIKNDSAKLKDNYEKFLVAGKNFSLAEENYLRSLELGGAWSHAAHHIISGNQVFKQVPEVVKISHACGYDINSAENCIMLATLSRTEKSAAAFDVMSLTGLQWHVGGHSYSFNEDELAEMEKQIARRTGRSGKVESYDKLLIKKLRALNSTIDRDICPARLITALNNLANEVREKLAAFKKNPAASYPFYVSREAYFFAFKVPVLKKFITVEKNFFKLYKTGGKGDVCNLKDSLASDDARAIIKFCGNVRHFVFLGGVDEKILPFKPEFKMRAENFNPSEIIVWLRENPADDYVAPLKKILERLKSLEDTP